jgi:hypothetical protein
LRRGGDSTESEEDSATAQAATTTADEADEGAAAAAAEAERKETNRVDGLLAKLDTLDAFDPDAHVYKYDKESNTLTPEYKVHLSDSSFYPVMLTIRDACTETECQAEVARTDQARQTLPRVLCHVQWASTERQLPAFSRVHSGESCAAALCPAAVHHLQRTPWLVSGCAEEHGHHWHQKSEQSM